jgi:hypothetical protein
MPASSRCPICKREIPAGDGAAATRPFCSERCRSVDLGSWLEGRYRVAAAVDEDDSSPSPKANDDEGD